MSDREYRQDVGTPIPAYVEDCAHCGADVSLGGKCSAACEASRRAEATTKPIRKPRMG